MVNLVIHLKKRLPFIVPDPVRFIFHSDLTELSKKWFESVIPQKIFTTKNCSAIIWSLSIQTPKGAIITFPLS